jgi:NADH-quinone oxidoreductase subunit G
VVASSRPSTLDPNAAATLRFAPGSAEAALVALAAALGSERAPGPVEYLAGSARAGEDAVRSAADVLRDAGDVVVIWGERVAAGERGGHALDALLAIASDLGIGGKPESGLIEVPSGANGRGLREVGCVPTLGPGLRDAAGDGMTAAEIAASGEVGALLLVEHDLPAERLAAASTVVAFARFPSEALTEHADVVFPAEIYPEKEGTVTHPDGRLQRVRQALGHADEVRPGWHVLHDLCERLGVGFGALTAPMVTARLAEAVPFYAGITLEEIGGLGVRWQEREAASGLQLEEISTAPLAVPPASERGLLLAAAPTLWSGPEVERSPSLRFLSTRARAEMSVEDAREAGVETGDEVRLTVYGERAAANGAAAEGSAILAIAAVRSAVPAGSVFVSGASVPEGPVSISPARQPVAAG